METKNTSTEESRKEPTNASFAFVEYGNEIEDIISNKLPPVIQWGTVYFSLILLLTASISWFIRYPDIIKTSAKLVSINAPKPVITNVSGKLIKLNTHENENVKKNQVLGFMESTADPEEVLELSAKVDTIQILLNTNYHELIPGYFKKPYSQLGELQAPYQTFTQAFLKYKDYMGHGFYLHKKKMLETDLNNLVKLHNNLLGQKKLIGQDLTLSQQQFKANLTLWEKEVISKSDYQNEKSKFINKKLLLPQIVNSIINNEALQNQKQEEIAELENTINEQKTIFEQAINTFRSQIDSWEKKYFLIAPISGKVAFATFIQENQQVQANQTVCYVNPSNSRYYTQVIIPQSNLGKVKIGQTVLLKFPSYPSEEYGVVKGRIDFISYIATDNGYYARVELVHGLKTNYDYQIHYRDGLEANAEIITKNMRLLRKFYFNIVKQMQNR